MKILGKIFTFILFCCMGFACLDEIPLEVTSTDSILVIGGSINNSAGPHKVRISRSAIFGSGPSGIPDPVLGASVSIVAEAGERYNLIEQENGYYQTTINQLVGEIGANYFLEVTINGDNYISTPDKILPVPTIDSLSFSYDSEDVINEAGNFSSVDQVSILLNTSFPNNEEETFLKWNSFGEYEYAEISSPGNLNPDICYITEDIDFDQVAVARSSEVLNKTIRQQPIITRVVDYRFSARYCFHVIQQSVTLQTYEFWSAIGEEFERSGSIFESPPGKVRGNISNLTNPNEEVLGIFSASAVDTATILLVRADVGSPRPQCRPFPRPPSTCDNCLIIPNSTRTKPSCWR